MSIITCPNCGTQIITRKQSLNPTPRELEAWVRTFLPLQLWHTPLTSAQVASQMGISPATVRKLISRMRAKCPSLVPKTVQHPEHKTGSFDHPFTYNPQRDDEIRVKFCK